MARRTFIGNLYKKVKDPTLVEAEHPKLHDLYIRLARYLGPIPYRTDNLDSFKNYLEVSQETLLAA